MATEKTDGYSAQPPLGLRPKCIVDDNRRKEIIAAIVRYMEASCIIPQEWFDEYNQLAGMGWRYTHKDIR